MLFSSLTFLFVFLPLLLGVYFISKEKYRNYILLAFSLIFYAWGEPKFLILMIISIIFNYLLALGINRYEKIKKPLLIFGVIANIGFLVFFKYTNFLIESINNIANLNYDFFDIALPIGISFYTFQILSYIIDSYYKRVKVQKNIFTLATYIVLFPQLIAGPIVRYETIEQELKSRKVTLESFSDGLKRFIFGLAKKVIIANNTAIVADAILNTEVLNTDVGMIVTIIGLISYTIQIYFDFSGYSDMAIGLGKMLGFNFLENFNYPYISTSITDFWKRWHISLSTWFKDYIYIPLGGNRVGKIRWYINILIVWCLTGLWHGASWNFVIWGIYFAAILIFEKIFLLKILNKIPKFFSWLYSIILIMGGWLIFRLETTGNILAFFNQSLIIGDNTVQFIVENFKLLNSIPFIIIGIAFSFPIAKKIKLPVAVQNITCLILFGLCIGFLLLNSYNPFIYFRF